LSARRSKARKSGSHTTLCWREMDSNHWSPVGGQHFSRPPFGRSGLALPRGRRSVPPKRRGRSAVDEVGLIDIVGRWNSSLNINLTPVVDDEDRLPFAWAGQATLDHVRWRNCGARRYAVSRISTTYRTPSSGTGRLEPNSDQAWQPARDGLPLHLRNRHRRLRLG
jgi:hypothetical protein